MSTTFNERFVVCHILTKEIPLEASRAINTALVAEMFKMLDLGEPDVETDEMGLVPCDDISVLNADITVNYCKTNIPPVVAIVYDQCICSQAYEVMNELVEQFEGIAYTTKVITVNDDVYNCLLFTVNMRSVAEFLASINRDDVCLVNSEYMDAVHSHQGAG